MKPIFATLALLVAVNANAQIFKCQVGGKTVFSDQECKGGVLVKVDTSVQPVPIANQTANSPVEVTNRIKRKLISDDIDRAELRIAEINRTRESELSELSRRVSGRSTTARDAIDKNTIAVQMGVINDTYNRRVADIQKEIVKLNSDRDSVGK